MCYMNKLDLDKQCCKDEFRIYYNKLVLVGKTVAQPTTTGLNLFNV